MDTDGCPDIDNDSDGILDVNDKCPNEQQKILTDRMTKMVVQKPLQTAMVTAYSTMLISVSQNQNPLTSTLMKTAAQIQHPHWFDHRRPNRNHPKDSVCPRKVDHFAGELSHSGPGGSGDA